MLDVGQGRVEIPIEEVQNNLSNCYSESLRHLVSDEGITLEAMLNHTPQLSNVPQNRLEALRQLKTTVSELSVFLGLEDKRKAYDQTESRNLLVGLLGSVYQVLDDYQDAERKLVNSSNKFKCDFPVILDSFPRVKKVWKTSACSYAMMAFFTLLSLIAFSASTFGMFYSIIKMTGDHYGERPSLEALGVMAAMLICASLSSFFVYYFSSTYLTMKHYRGEANARMAVLNAIEDFKHSRDPVVEETDTRGVWARFFREAQTPKSDRLRLLDGNGASGNTNDYGAVSHSMV